MAAPILRLGTFEVEPKRLTHYLGVLTLITATTQRLGAKDERVTVLARGSHPGEKRHAGIVRAFRRLLSPGGSPACPRPA